MYENRCRLKNKDNFISTMEGKVKTVAQGKVFQDLHRDNLEQVKQTIEQFRQAVEQFKQVIKSSYTKPKLISKWACQVVLSEQCEWSIMLVFM